ELVARAIARTLRGESPYNIEFRIIKPDGQVRWIGNQGAVHRGPDGEPERFVGLCCDITERKRTEQKLTLYKEIFDNSIDGIAVIDPQGYYLEQNSAHRSIVGYTDEELRDKTPAIHLGEEVFSNLTQELATSGMYRGEVISHTKNGASIPLELSAFAVRNDLGEQIYYVGIKRDITERKRTEQQLYQRIDQLQSIYNLNDTVSKAKALEEIYEEALDGLQCTLNTKRASILLIDPDGVMRFKAWRGLSDKYRKAVEGHSPWSPGENNPKPILIPDVAERSDLGALRETILGEAIGAMGFIPLVYQGRLLGKFMVYYDAPHQFSDDEIQLVQTISSHVAFAIERKQGEEALKMAYDELEIRVQERTRELVEVNKALQSEIAERERMEKGLHQSEQRFRLLVESVKDYAIFMLDTDGTIVSWNAGAEYIMGYKSEEIIGKHFSTFYPEEDIEHGRPQHNLGIAVAEGRYEDEGWRERKDGSKFWANVVITALRDEYGNLRGFSEMTRDTTERNAAEEQIREQATLLDKAQDAIIAQDLEHRIIFWNKGAENLYGWTAKEAIGKKNNELLYKRGSFEFIEAYRSVIEKGEWMGELHHINKKGEEVIVESRWTLVRDNGGNPKSVLVIDTNIMERKKLEAQFLRAQRMESVGTLASGIAHDLNNILSPIMMVLQLLRKKLTDENSRELLDMLDMSAQRGADLIRQVLSFARGPEGSRTILQLRYIISEIERILRETFPRSIEIDTDIPKD